MSHEPERASSFVHQGSEGATVRVRARDSIFALLSVSERGNIGMAVSARQLQEGEEYIDLERITLGICKSDGGPIPGGRLLRKRAVREQTWYEVLTKLSTDGMLSLDSSR